MKMCPVCACGEEIGKRQAKAEFVATNQQEAPRLEFYSKHILANKPKGILKTDNSYEFWVKDLSNGEETCIGSCLMKDNIKEMKKQRGIHDFHYINVE